MENADAKMLHIIADFTKAHNRKPKLLLHVCCAVCCAAALDRLHELCDITCFYYNPNILDKVEYEKRYDNLMLLCDKYTQEYGGKTAVEKGEYETAKYLCAVAGKEDLREGDIRCADCFTLRLEKTAEKAADYDFFATTLTLSPHKNANLINLIGKGRGELHNSVYLPTDFKKNGGVLISAQLCVKYGIYRQNYCGCGFPLNQ